MKGLGLQGPTKIFIDAAHNGKRILVVPQEIAQDELTNKSGRPGQKHLLEVSGRYRRSGRSLADSGTNERAQCLNILSALWRQCSHERRDHGVGN